MTAEFPGLTKAEQSFFRYAKDERGAKLWRAGWPDFLMHIDSMGYVGVEVKAGDDPVRPAQRAMFETLELAGIKVFVWHHASPKRLGQVLRDPSRRARGTSAAQQLAGTQARCARGHGGDRASEESRSDGASARELGSKAKAV